MRRGKRHYRLTLDDALSAHVVALQSGGLDGVLDQGRIEAAIARPYVGYFRAIEDKASAVFEAIVNNHGFVDGNKRTAILLTDLLIKKSGYLLVSANPLEDLNLAIEELAVAVASGNCEFEMIATWFNERLVRSS